MRITPHIVKGIGETGSTGKSSMLPSRLRSLHCLIHTTYEKSQAPPNHVAPSTYLAHKDIPVPWAWLRALLLASAARWRLVCCCGLLIGVCVCVCVCVCIVCVCVCVCVCEIPMPAWQHERAWTMQDAYVRTRSTDECNFRTHMCWQHTHICRQHM